MTYRKVLSYKILLIFFMLPVLLFPQNGSDETEELRKEIKKLQPGKSGFLLRGYGHSGIEFYDDDNSFVGGSFNPIFLWKQSENLLFESELEIELEDGETKIGLDYANLSYTLNEFMTLRLGKFLMPFGTFSERLHSRWINRLPSNPLGFSHDDQVGPMSQVGVEVRGVIPVDFGAGINYSVYIVNGPNLNDGSDEPEGAGMLHYDNFDDNNKNKAFGGRIGILPIDDSSLEIGFSGQYAKVGNSDSEYKNVGAALYSADISYVRRLTFIKSMLDIKGQWNRVDVDKAEYLGGHDGDELILFDNSTAAYFGQVSIKPAFVKNNLVNKLEFVARYSEFKGPEETEWGLKKTQITLGINYWLDWRTVIKVAYQSVDLETEEEGDGHAPAKDGFLVHWSIGF
jgi:hypothetical protein